MFNYFPKSSNLMGKASYANLWTKIVSFGSAIEGKCLRDFTIIMILGVVVFHLECSKIDHQRLLKFCTDIDSFKCENGGVRMYSKENGLSCWCTQNYVGEHCQKRVSFMSPIISMFRFGNSEVSKGRPTMWWSVFPFTSGPQLKTIYDFHQNSVKRLENVFAGSNNGGYGPRILPPACPLECCANDKTSPPLEKLYNKVLKRKPGQLIPDRKNRNLLLDAFYQYFVLQFFDANSNLTVTASQLYGSDDMSEKSMRSFSGGKLKTSAINYKPFATKHAFAPYSDVYLTALTKDISIDRSWPIRMNARLPERAEMLSTGTMFYVMSLLWAREHNRVCAELSQKWPTWTDEELYTKARKIVTVQMMNIMMTDILNVELRPEVYYHRMENIRGSSKPFELYLMMAVSNLPEKLQYSSRNLTSYNNASQVSEAALKDSLRLMMTSKMSMVTANDDGTLTEQLTKTLMILSREQCLQSFNNYRRRLGLPAYKSFFDLTGNVETATALEKLYSTVEKVELLTGVLTEKSSSGVLPTAKVLCNSYIVNAILANSVTTKHLWAPDTFGGVEFFNMVKSTSLESLVCRNMDNCNELKNESFSKFSDPMGKASYANLWTKIVSFVAAIKKRVSFMSPIISMFRFGKSEVSKGRPTILWSIFPFTSGSQLKTIYDFHQNSVKRLENVFADSNNGGYGPRILPPACPLERCANDKTSPPLEKLYNKVLKRKPGQLIPDRKNRNLLLDAFYQYFVLQFFDANSNLTVTASQLYGSDDMSERSMRSFSGGKLKTNAINYKPFATKHAFAPYSDVYLTALTKDISIDRSWPSRMNARTMFYVMSLLWAREHNRMCAELSQKWPTWTDEELYIKASKIVTRQMMVKSTSLESLVCRNVDNYCNELKNESFAKFSDPMGKASYANLWAKIVSFVSAIEGTCVREFTIFLMLSVVVVHLECSKIEKHVSFMSPIISLFRLGNSEVSRGRLTMWWSIFPFTSRFQLKTIYAFHQNSVKRLENVFAGSNNGGYGPRILPPACPLERCANDKTFPPLEKLYNKILKRKPGQFIPDGKNSNLLFDAFYQYFVLQFFDANSNLTVTASQLYGSDDMSERSMRSFYGSKLKTRAINYKHFATNHALAPYSDVYLTALTKDISIDRSWPSRMNARLSERAEMLSTGTMFYVMSLLWAREHNWMCAELSQKWPTWTDEELYIKARKIVTRQMMNIIMTEIQNVELRQEGYHHQMEYIRGSGNPFELHLTMAVSNVPEKLQCSSTNLTSYSNASQVSEAALNDSIQVMMSSMINVITVNDDGTLTEQLTKTLMILSREQCLQGFNNYRRRLGLPAYKNFFDLTGNVETATALEKLCSTVEKVELLTVVLTEKSISGVLPTEGTCVREFTIFLMLSAVVVHLECSKIEKRVSFMSPIISLFHLGNSEVSRGRPTMWWSIFPFTSRFQLKTIYALHQNSVKRLENVFAGSNNGGYGPRILPPACPLERCANDITLPPLETLYNKILKPKPSQFITDRKNRNLLLDAFNQYFVFQFFDPNSKLTVTASQLYGSDDMSERSMRSFYGSKLKTRAINYKHFATNHAFEPFSNVYLKVLIKGIWFERSWPSRMNVRLFERAEILSTSTMSLLWARERNRLSQKWPTWTDEELYPKVRKILTGQMMNIMMTEIRNVELRPEVYHHRMENFRGSDKTFKLYSTMAVSNMPEKLQCSSTNLTSYSNASQVSEAALKDSIQLMMSPKISMATANDVCPLEPMGKSSYANLWTKIVSFVSAIGIPILCRNVGNVNELISDAK